MTTSLRSCRCFSRLHFAPTLRAAQALEREGIASRDILVAGNTVVDAQLWVCERHHIRRRVQGRGHILVTMHRRENWGPDIDNVCAAIADIARDFLAMNRQALELGFELGTPYKR